MSSDLNATVAFMKRTLDICGALIALIIVSPVVPLLMLAIKLDSPGPVIFRQMRVGQRLKDRTILFEMYKFRSMRADAEAKTGPVWATKNDPRITKVGLMMRKTRLDEIPQLINVLQGHMSLVGPRPERPGICDKLENEIPFYVERTYGLRPGITGLAQVCQGYDETIEDVRNKVYFDFGYALSLRTVRHWLLMDLSIVFKTLKVVALGRGQ